MWSSESKQIKPKHKTNAQTQLSQAMKLEGNVKENWLRKDGRKLESCTGWLFLSLVRGSAVQSYYWHMEVIVYWNWNHTCAMLCTVAQLCLTLCDPMYCNPRASSAHGIFQARKLEWVAISLSRGSFRASETPISCVSCTGRWILNHWAIWESGDNAWLRIS